MSTQYFLIFFGLIFPLVFSPGPANIVFAMSGMRQGIKASMPLMVGVDLVYIIYSLIVGFGLGEILQLYPSLTFILQFLGSLYIVYLAYKFLNSGNNKKINNEKIFTFTDGVILQTLNPKGWSILFLMFSVLLDGSFDQNTQVIYLVLMLAVLNISTHFIWIIAGSQISKWTSNKKIDLILNYLFSGSLLLVAIWLLLQLFID